jgi:hypothetical protein
MKGQKSCNTKRPSCSSPFCREVAPDWEWFLRCVRREGSPDRVHIIELFLDKEVKQALCERFGLTDGLQPGDPHFFHEREIRLQRFLGYDYVRCGLDGPEMPMNRLRVEDTAALGRDGGRQYMEEHRGPITNWEEFERYPWPDPYPLVRSHSCRSGAGGHTRHYPPLSRNSPDGARAHSLLWLGRASGFSTTFHPGYLSDARPRAFHPAYRDPPPTDYFRSPPTPNAGAHPRAHFDPLQAWRVGTLPARFTSALRGSDPTFPSAFILAQSVLGAGLNPRPLFQPFAEKTTICNQSFYVRIVADVRLTDRGRCWWHRWD